MKCQWGNECQAEAIYTRPAKYPNGHLMATVLCDHHGADAERLDDSMDQPRSERIRLLNAQVIAPRGFKRTWQWL